MAQCAGVFDTDAAHDLHFTEACAQPGDDGGVAHDLWPHPVQRPLLRTAGGISMGLMYHFGCYMEQCTNGQRPATFA